MIRHFYTMEIIIVGIARCRGVSGLGDALFWVQGAGWSWGLRFYCVTGIK